MLVTVVDEHRFRAMGTECHVQVVDGPTRTVDVAEAIVRDDEARWSRFRPDSEVSVVNAAPGRPVPVSVETLELIRRALDAVGATRGWFDPLLGAQVVAAGYDRTFESVLTGGPVEPAATEPARIDPGVTVGERTVTIPPGTRLDVGGIAKGHTADRVVSVLLSLGAAGACVNIGGDLACAGASPDGSGWWCAVDHRPGWAVGLVRGGVATSTTTRRRWLTTDGSVAHHLIDPTTGRPSASGVASATVVAGDAATAEVLTKVVLLAPVAVAATVLDQHGAVAVATGTDGTERRIGAVDALLHPTAAP